MPTDNVVPIDDDAARVLARQPGRFRWFVAAVVVTWLGVLVPVLLFTPLPPLLPFLALATLMVLAEHRFVLFGDETSMSGGVVVVVASVFAFSDSSPFAGPILVASLGALYMPHLRRRQFSLVLANSSIYAIGISGACFVVYFVSPRSLHNLIFDAISIVAIVGCHWVANSTLVGAATSARNGVDMRRSFTQQVTSDGVVLVLAAGAGFAGVAGSEGSIPALIGLLLIPLAAFEIRLNVQRRRDLNSGSLSTDTRVLVLCTTAALLFASTTMIGVGLACTALFLALTFFQPWRAISTSVLIATIGGAATALLLQSASVPVVVQAAAVAVVAFTLLSFSEIGVQLMRASISISPYVLFGTAIPGARDVPKLAGATAVVCLVAYGASSTGLFFAGGIVIVAVGVSSVRRRRDNVTDDQDSVIVP